MAFVNKFSSVCFKEGRVKIAQGRMTRRKPEVEPGCGDTVGGPGAQASPSAASSGGVDTVGILSEFRIRRLILVKSQVCRLPHESPPESFNSELTAWGGN